MKILNWVQSKLKGGKLQESKRPAVTYSCQESIEWPDGFLAIGTLGQLNQDNDRAAIGEFEKELGQLLINRGVINSIPEEEEDETIGGGDMISLEYLKQLSCFEDHESKKKLGLGRKTLSLLVKKMFMSQTTSFLPTPSLRDPIPDKSTMDKILRALMQKRIYPQSSTTKQDNAKKYLESQMEDVDDEDDTIDLDHKQMFGSCKWVKTDSEYIVLEI